MEMTLASSTVAGTTKASSNHSHVNREYRRLSGAPPRQDAARLRVGS